MVDEGSRAVPAGASSWRKRIFAWGLAVLALAFVIHAVPIRDRCRDPGAVAGERSQSFPLSVTLNGCIAHLPSGDAAMAPPECARLRCEPGLLSTLKGASVPLLLAFVPFYFLTSLVWAVRWRSLLVLAKVEIGLLQTWRITIEAQAGGVLLPGGVGGDALRVGFVVGRGAKLPIVIASVLMDRAIGLASLAGVAAVVAATLGGSGMGGLPLILGAIPIGFVAGVALLRFGPVAQVPFFSRGRVGRVIRPILDYVGDPGAPRAILRAFGISLFIAAAQLVLVRGFVAALGATPTAERWIYVGSTMSFIVAALPVLPGGWGTADAAYVFFLGKAGLLASTALAVCLLFRLFWYLMAIVGAMLYLGRRPTSGGGGELARE